MSEKAKGVQVDISGTPLPDVLNTMQQDIDSKAESSYVDTELAKKSDTVYVDSQLLLKADSAAVALALATKADASALVGLASEAYVNNAVSTKAEASALNGLASETYVDNAVSTKADSTAVANALADKADASAVASALGDKADASALSALDAAAVKKAELKQTTGGSEDTPMSQKAVTQAIAAGVGEDIVREAPEDGKQYARKDATWVETSGGGIPVLEPSGTFTDTTLNMFLHANSYLGMYRVKCNWVSVSNDSKRIEDLLVTVIDVLQLPEGDFTISRLSGSYLNYQSETTPISGLSASDNDGNGTLRIGTTDSWAVLLQSDIASYNGYLADYKEYSKWSKKMLTVDPNGFLKESSPIINLYADRTSNNGASEVVGHTLTVADVGLYILTDVPLLSREGWYIETPKDRNGQPYFMLDYEEYPEEQKLVIKTYGVAYDNGKAVNGEPTDILEGRFVSLRFSEEEKEEDVL